MQQLTLRQRLLVASMLFGMFFGAGNLIFPASMGQLAGRSIWQASAGFLITGVGLPLLGVAALGISHRKRQRGGKWSFSINRFVSLHGIRLLLAGPQDARRGPAARPLRQCG